MTGCHAAYACGRAAVKNRAATQHTKSASNNSIEFFLPPKGGSYKAP